MAGEELAAFVSVVKASTNMIVFPYHLQGANKTIPSGINLAEASFEKKFLRPTDKVRIPKC